jgi:signal peptidase I
MRGLQLPRYIGKSPETYRPTVHTWGPIVVPPASYWVMGDNRDESYDSRYWGFLPRSHVEGRPLFIYLSVASDPFRIRWNREFKHPS